jgi:hypothetical protein
LLSYSRFDERKFCRESDGIVVNEQVTCVSPLSIIKSGIACSAGLALGVQWWAAWGVWQWGKVLKSNMGNVINEQERADNELGYGDEKNKMGLSI